MSGNALTTLRIAGASSVATINVVLPEMIEQASPKLRKRFVEFFGASIRNPNTRGAYLRACDAFFAFLDDIDVGAIEEIAPLHVAAWLEALQGDRCAVATQKQYLAAVRMLLDYLVTGGLLPHNPALSVRAPRQSIAKGKTPTLTADECGELLRSIKTDNLVGLRDRALIGTMVFTFARISAALSLKVGDTFKQKKRLWVRLHEKGGKVHDMPCHHTLEEYLGEYMEVSGLVDAGGSVPLFQSFKRRPYGRGAPELSGRALTRIEAWAMIQRRAAAAGVETRICNHTFRGTGITAYLENGGTLENAQRMAAHASTRTTQLYDRRRDDVTLDEVVKINIRG
jgi:site-specific recombinase XerD